MMYDLIEVTPKMNKKKVIIVCIITILVVSLFTIMGIEFAKHSKENINNNTVAANEIISESINKTKHIANANMNPIYTDTGKELMKNIYHSQEKVVYLTFDDGPSKSVTPLILDLLKQENIKATFFVLGARAKANPEILKREYLEGHYIANHGYSHIYGNIYSSPDAVLEEYNKTRDVIKEILGTDYDGHLFRFPGGSTGGKYKQIKKDAKTILDENNIAYIDWNSLSSDAAGAKTKEAIIQNTIDTVGSKNSVVILMHDAGDKILTYEALPEIITYLKEQGYNFKNFYSVIK
ncbi:MAG: polysaccharide deacetylase [Clostridia bacterium]|nr:polysaccharide deacetylase [Clostridia bacterium]